jgi:hypothetical protein
LIEANRHLRLPFLKINHCRKIRKDTGFKVSCLKRQNVIAKFYKQTAKAAAMYRANMMTLPMSHHTILKKQAKAVENTPKSPRHHPQNR